MNHIRRQKINIAIVGTVSVGKSTLMNAMFVEQYSDMKIKRTTMIPQVYDETDHFDRGNIAKNSADVFNRNREKNNSLIKKIETGELISKKDICEIHYEVPRMIDVVDIHESSYISIYDIPGLNDSRTKDIYTEYIEDNFYKFDIILLVIDVQSGTNTSDEIDTIRLLIKNIHKNKQNHNIDNKLVVIVNKCDDMLFIDGSLKMDDEREDMYEQVRQTIEHCRSDIYPNLSYSMLRLSAEESFVCRMYKYKPESKLDDKYINKFGNNKFGKLAWNRFTDNEKSSKIKELMHGSDYEQMIVLSGFCGFKEELKRQLTPELQLRYLQNHIIYELRYTMDHHALVQTDIYQALEELSEYKKHIHVIIEKYDNVENNLLEIFQHIFVTQMVRYFESDDVTRIIDSVPVSEIQCRNIVRIMKVCDLIKILFPELWSIYHDIYKTLQESMNRYYINAIKATNILESKLESVDKLIANQCDRWKRVMIDIFGSQCSLFTKTNQFIADTLIGIKTIYGMSNDEMLEITVKTLTRIYEQKTVDARLLENIILKTTNPYYGELCNLNAILRKSESRSNTEIVNVVNTVEQYLYDLLKEGYPQDTCTRDQLIDIVNMNKN